MGLLPIVWGLDGSNRGIENGQKLLIFDSERKLLPCGPYLSIYVHIRSFGHFGSKKRLTNFGLSFFTKMGTSQILRKYCFNAEMYGYIMKTLLFSHYDRFFPN